jgi:hypothetical protein
MGALAVSYAAILPTETRPAAGRNSRAFTAKATAIVDAYTRW